MKEERTGVSLSSGGGSTLMVIFSVLCLLTFAVLSLATVTADKRLADASVEAVEEWYAADTMAEEILAEIRRGECPEGVQVEGNLYSYSCPINENRSLFVNVLLNGRDCDILRWQAVNTDLQEYGSEDNFWRTVTTENG